MLFLPPKKGKTHVLRLIRELIYHEAKDRGTDIAHALDTIQNILNSKKIITAPFWLLKFLAIGGDLIKIIFRFDPPLTTFRLNNMMTGGSYHMDNTKEIVGELPYDLNESVYLTSKWMYEKKMIKHKPNKI